MIDRLMYISSMIYPTPMELISLNDAKSRIEDIDELVRNGEFSSRAEVYRTGALLMITRPAARELAKKGQLDRTLFGNHIKTCLNAIKSNDLDKMHDELRFVIDGLIFRELLSTVLSEDKDRIAFETIREGLTLYEKNLAKINVMDEDTRNNFLSDLTRDLSILENYIEESTKQEIQLDPFFSKYQRGIDWMWDEAKFSNAAFVSSAISTNLLLAYAGSETSVITSSTPPPISSEDYIRVFRDVRRNLFRQRYAK